MTLPLTVRSHFSVQVEHDLGYQNAEWGERSCCAIYSHQFLHRVNHLHSFFQGGSSSLALWRYKVYSIHTVPCTLKYSLSSCYCWPVIHAAALYTRCSMEWDPDMAPKRFHRGWITAPAAIRLPPEIPPHEALSLQRGRSPRRRVIPLEGG